MKIKFGSRLKYGNKKELQEKMFQVRDVYSIEWLINFIKYNNANNIRTLALIHGGSNE